MYTGVSSGRMRILDAQKKVVFISTCKLMYQMIGCLAMKFLVQNYY